MTRICTVLVWLRNIQGEAPEPCGGGEEEIVERIAGRVLGGDIQGLEIVPFIFNFGTIDGRKAESPHDLLQGLDGLSDRVESTQLPTRSGDGEVKDVVLRARRSFLQSLLRTVEGGLDGRFDLIEFKACVLASVGRQVAHALLDRLQAALPRTEEFHPRGVQRIGRIHGGERRDRLLSERIQGGDKFRKRHDRGELFCRQGASRGRR